MMLKAVMFPMIMLATTTEFQEPPPPAPPLQCAPILDFRPGSVEDSMNVLRCWQLVIDAKWGGAEERAALKLIHYVQENSKSDAELIFVSEVGVGLHDDYSLRILQLIAISGNTEAIDVLASIHMVLGRQDSVTSYLLQQAAIARVPGAAGRLTRYLESHAEDELELKNWQACLGADAPSNAWVRICQRKLGAPSASESCREGRRNAR